MGCKVSRCRTAVPGSFVMIVDVETMEGKSQDATKHTLLEILDEAHVDFAEIFTEDERNFCLYVVGDAPAFCKGISPAFKNTKGVCDSISKAKGYIVGGHPDLRKFAKKLEKLKDNITMQCVGPAEYGFIFPPAHADGIFCHHALISVKDQPEAVVNAEPAEAAEGEEEKEKEKKSDGERANMSAVQRFNKLGDIIVISKMEELKPYTSILTTLPDGKALYINICDGESFAKYADFLASDENENQKFNNWLGMADDIQGKMYGEIREESMSLVEAFKGDFSLEQYPFPDPDNRRVVLNEKASDVEKEKDPEAGEYIMMPKPEYELPVNDLKEEMKKEQPENDHEPKPINPLTAGLVDNIMNDADDDGQQEDQPEEKHKKAADTDSNLIMNVLEAVEEHATAKDAADGEHQPNKNHVDDGKMKTLVDV